MPSMDNVSKAKRSEIMSKVKSKDTKIELLVRGRLFARGFRYRKNVSGLPGKPDILMPGRRVAIFVHGCFWHGHPSCVRMPSTRKSYWKQKIEGNAQRDARNQRRLRRMGWSVFVLWECKL